MTVIHTSLAVGVSVVCGPRGEPEALTDSLIERTITLSKAARAVVDLLSSSTLPLPEVVTLACAAVPRAEVDTALRALMALTVVDGSGEDIRHAVRFPLTAPVSVPGAQFQCGGSGACCMNHRLGPLRADDTMLLQDLSSRPAFPLQRGTTWVETRPGADGKDATYLATVDGRCVFLDDARRCRLHAAFGAEGKPGFCRAYPLEAIHTVAGVRILDRGTCASLESSSRSGPLLVHQATALRLAVPTHAKLWHPMVFLRGSPLDFGHLQRWVTVALDVAARHHGSERILAVARRLAAFEHALRTFPIRTGEPGATLDVALATEGPPLEPAPSAAAALLSDLRNAVEGPLSSPAWDGHRLATELAPSLRMLAEGQRARAPTEGQDAALGRALAGHLFGRDLVMADRAWPALVRRAVVDQLALLHAQSRGEQTFSHGHMLAMRVTEAAERVFLAHEAHAPAIIAALAG